MSRRTVAIIASTAVIATVVIVVVLSLVPFPQFPVLTAGKFEGQVAFISADNCVTVAELPQATVRQLRCESEEMMIANLTWTAAGIEITNYTGQPTTRILDPVTGEVIGIRTGGEVLEEPPSRDSLATDNSSGRVIVFDEQGQEILVLTGPARYTINVAIPRPGGRLVAIIDSQGRLAVFDRMERMPYLVSERARSWPYPSWQD
jgi:hypothetical protein